MNAPQNADVNFENAKSYTKAFFQELDKIDHSLNHPVERLDALLSLYKKNCRAGFVCTACWRSSQINWTIDPKTFSQSILYGQRNGFVR